MTLKIGALTKLGLFFPVVCFIYVFDRTLAEQLYPDKGLLLECNQNCLFEWSHLLVFSRRSGFGSLQWFSSKLPLGLTTDIFLFSVQEKETSMLSQQETKDSAGTLADTVSFGPTECSLGNSECQTEQDQREDSPHEMTTKLETTGTKENAREHTVLSELNREENERIERCQETGFSEMLQSNGREKCLPGNDFKDVTPKEGLPQNELKQGSGVVIIHSVSTAIPLQDAALRSIDGSTTVEEYQETDGVTNEVETNTAMTEDQKQKGGDLSEKDKVSEKDDSSSGQPENTDNDRSSSGVAHQMKKETSIINAEKAVNVDFLLDVDCVMDCTDSQLVHLGEESLEATMDTSEQMWVVF